jgi:4-carboxymuconolactone decarboxylase
MVEQGQDMVRAFNPGLETFQVKGFETMFPTMSRDMMEMWFGKTFNREGLDAKTRLLVTIAALTVLGAQAEPQLRLAIRHALEAGATRREIAEVIWQMSLFGGTEGGKPLPTESRAELVAEHERLVDVLRSPSHADDKVEAAISAISESWSSGRGSKCGFIRCGSSTPCLSIT